MDLTKTSAGFASFEHGRFSGKVYQSTAYKIKNKKRRLESRKQLMIKGFQLDSSDIMP
jgi:hypothetical protein